MNTHNLISVGQIIDRSWEHYTKHFKAIMSVALWYFLVAFLLMIGAILSPTNNGLLVQGGSFTVLEALGLSITVLTSLIVTPLVGIWIFMTLAKIVDAQENNKPFDQKEINKNTWSKMISYIVMGLLRGLAVFAPVLIILPGLALLLINIFTDGGAVLGSFGLILTFLGTLTAIAGCFFVVMKLSFSGFELVLNGKSSIESIKSSMNLVKGRFWPTALRLVLPKLVYSIPIIILHLGSIAVLNVGLASFSTVNNEVIFKIANISGSLITMIITALAVPIILISDYLVYESLRKNK